MGWNRKSPRLLSSKIFPTNQVLNYFSLKIEAYRKGMLEYYERSSDNTTLECVEYAMNWKGIRLGTENNLLLSKFMCNLDSFWTCLDVPNEKNEKEE